MPENSTLIQLNFKPTSTMINAYCGDEAEIDEALGLIEKNAGRIMQTEVLLRTPRRRPAPSRRVGPRRGRATLLLLRRVSRRRTPARASSVPTAR